MNRRKYYLDYLRIIAILGVIFMHTGGHCQGENIRSLNWQVCNIFNTGTRWAVPTFVMISGSLFLKKDINLKRIYSKNILRLVIAFVFWSTIYTLVFSTFKYYNLFSIQGIFNTITGMFKGYYHMWFIFMIIGLYMVTPILKVCIDNISEKLLKYWMFISFIL